MSQFAGAPPGVLRRLADAFRTKQLGSDASEFSISRVVPCTHALASAVIGLANEGAAPEHIALILDAAADTAELRASHASAELVWSGPEVEGSQSRDTMSVLQQLFEQAERDVIVSTFVVQQSERVFLPLAKRMEALPGLNVRLFLHIARGLTDTALDSELVREFGDGFRRRWPGQRLPQVFYDPRGLETDSAHRATWHAKGVVVDEDLSFVTSANFTQWAQTRNVEAGVLVKGTLFNSQLRNQFEGLVRSGLVVRVPGF